MRKLIKKRKELAKKCLDKKWKIGSGVDLIERCPFCYDAGNFLIDVSHCPLCLCPRILCNRESKGGFIHYITLKVGFRYSPVSVIPTRHLELMIRALANIVRTGFVGEAIRKKIKEEMKE